MAATSIALPSGDAEVAGPEPAGCHISTVQVDNLPLCTRGGIPHPVSACNGLPKAMLKTTRGNLAELHKPSPNFLPLKPPPIRSCKIGSAVPTPQRLCLSRSSTSSLWKRLEEDTTCDAKLLFFPRPVGSVWFGEPQLGWI